MFKPPFICLYRKKTFFFATYSLSLWLYTPWTHENFIPVTFLNPQSINFLSLWIKPAIAWDFMSTLCSTLPGPLVLEQRHYLTYFQYFIFVIKSLIHFSGSLSKSQTTPLYCPSTKLQQKYFLDNSAYKIKWILSLLFRTSLLKTQCI